MNRFEPVICTFPFCRAEFTDRSNFSHHFSRKHGKSTQFLLNSDQSNILTNNLHYEPSTSATNETEVVTELDPLVDKSEKILTCSEPVLNVAVNELQNTTVISACSDSSGLTTTDLNLELSVQEEIVHFCLEMIGHPDIPFSHVEFVVKRVAHLLSIVTKFYQQKVSSICENCDEECSRLISQKIIDLSNFVQNSFKQLQSKYRQEHFFLKKGLYIAPQQKFLGQTLKIRKINNRFRHAPVEESCVFIPLRTLFEMYLSQENVLTRIKEYMSGVTSEKVILKNIMQGEYWKNVTFHSDGITLPLCLFNDDFETGNALGSHAGKQKLNTTYISLPCLPPEKRGGLNSIFLGLVTKSSNLKTFGNRLVFKNIIKELIYLSKTGITVQNEKIYFQLAALLGDNLGLNAIGGFTTNFSKTDFSCRVCLADKAQRNTMTVENKSLLRNRQNYAAHLAKNDMKSTGIREPCFFNDVPNFFILENCVLDVLHDCHDGIIKYDLAFIFRYCIRTAKYFTLAQLNQHIVTFNFGCDNSSKPPMLSGSMLKKKTFKMSASETACLLKYLGIILGSLIPSDDKIWELYTALRRILDIVLSPALNPNASILLADYVAKHHSLYLQLTGRTLTPKFHNLVHYPRKILQLGPLVHLWGMRNEGKIQIMKQAATATRCRKNLSLTTGKRTQLQLAYRFSTKAFSNDTIEWGKAEKIKTNYGFVRKLNSLNVTTAVPECLQNDNTIRPSWVLHNGIKYCKGFALYVDVDEETSTPLFGVIDNIFVTEDKFVYFLLKNLRTIHFDELRFAFLIEPVESFSIIDINKLHDFHPHNAVKIPKGGTYISLLHNA